MVDETTDIPQRDGKDGYVGVMFSAYLKILSILQSPDHGTQPIAIYFIVHGFISGIPDPDEYKKIIIEFETLIVDLQKNRLKISAKKELTDEENRLCIIEASMKIIHKVFNYIDKHTGISKSNLISIPKDCSKCEYKLEKIKKEKETELGENIADCI